MSTPVLILIIFCMTILPSLIFCTFIFVKSKNKLKEKEEEKPKRFLYCKYCGLKNKLDAHRCNGCKAPLEQHSQKTKGH